MYNHNADHFVDDIILSQVLPSRGYMWQTFLFRHGNVNLVDSEDEQTFG